VSSTERAKSDNPSAENPTPTKYWHRRNHCPEIFSLVTDFLHNSFKSIESVPTCRSTTISYSKISTYILNRGQLVGFARNSKIRLSEDSLVISTLGRVHSIRGQSVHSLVWCCPEWLAGLWASRVYLNDEPVHERGRCGRAVFAYWENCGLTVCCWGASPDAIMRWHDPWPCHDKFSIWKRVLILVVLINETRRYRRCLPSDSGAMRPPIGGTRLVSHTKFWWWSRRSPSHAR